MHNGYNTNSTDWILDLLSISSIQGLLEIHFYVLSIFNIRQNNNKNPIQINTTRDEIVQINQI